MEGNRNLLFSGFDRSFSVEPDRTEFAQVIKCDSKTEKKVSYGVEVLDSPSLSSAALV